MPDPNRTITTPPALILCAEDEESLRADICDELKEAGYRVLEAADGHKALALIDHARPDLILCDINMPGRSGYDILKTVRDQRPDLADTPFVFLSALSHPHEIVDGKRLGADDYLVKPIDYDLLLATIDARLRQVRRIQVKSTREINELRHAMKDISNKAFAHAGRALDLVSPGIVLFDRHGHILYANRAARTLADKSGCLKLGQTISTSSPYETRQLHKAITDAMAEDARSRDEVHCLSLARSGEGRNLLALVCPLEINEDGPAVVLLLSDPEKRVQLPRNVVAKLFDLTPTEARIAMALAEGRRTEEIATDMTVSPTTVAFHLRNLFQKTDTNRQADLVALILAASMTLAVEA